MDSGSDLKPAAANETLGIYFPELWLKPVTETCSSSFWIHGKFSLLEATRQTPAQFDQQLGWKRKMQTILANSTPVKFPATADVQSMSTHL